MGFMMPFAMLSCRVSSVVLAALALAQCGGGGKGDVAHCSRRADADSRGRPDA